MKKDRIFFLYSTIIIIFSIVISSDGYSQEYYPPLDAYVDLSTLPQDLFTSGEEDDPSTTEDESNILDRIGVKDFLYSEIKNTAQEDIGARITGKLILNPGFRLCIPNLDVLEIIVGEGEFAFEMVAREEETEEILDPEREENYPFIFKIFAFPLQLRLKTDLLQPVKKEADGTFTLYEKNSDGQFVDGVGNPIYPDLVNTVDITIRYTWDGESEVLFTDPATSGIPSLAISTPFMIGESGVVMEVSDVRVDLSTASSPPGITDPAWRGIQFGNFTVNFTNGLEIPEMREGPGATPTRSEMAGIQLTNFSIGAGGFSGRIHGSTTGLLIIPLFGMDFEFTDIELEFQQNALIGAAIGGIIRDFPYFETDVKLALALDMQGNFKIGIASDDPNRNGAGLVEWTITDILTLEVQSISFEYKEQIFLTRLNGAMIPLFFDSDVEPSEDSDPRIAINGLTITSEGEVSLEGGWITLPEKRYIDFHAFKIELAQIGFGSSESVSLDQKWVGFSGGIELVEGLSASAKVKKLQFLWPKRDGGSGVDTKLEGIEVGFSKPGVVSFKGSVDWFEEANRKGFAGSILLNMEFIKTAVNGRLVIGETISDIGAPVTPVGTCITTPSTDPFKFFFVDLEANLPAGIPVFSNVSIYGFLGLFSYNMEPHICAFQTPLKWFEAHRTATNIVAGSPSPWIPQDGSVAFGLGVILGTTSDDGYAINTKVALTVAVPGPVVILSGLGNVVKERGKLTGSEDPMFSATAVFDGRQKVFLINLGIYLKIPESGLVLDLSAEGEAYFNLSNPNDWHLWMGKRTPESERIRAEVLKLFTANTYYMLDPSELAFGAKVGFDSRPKWKFGPLRVKLVVFIGYDVAISWRPTHAWGDMQLGGKAELSAFGFGVGLSANAGLTLETPTPYLIDGRLKVKLKLPWPLPDPSATVRLHWETPRPKEALEQLVTEMALEASKSTASIATEIEHSTTVSSGHRVSLSTLCSPWESLPVIPEIDEDLNGNGFLDPGEDFNGDGILNVSAPIPSCTGRPMVPVNYRPVVAFARNTNQLLSGSDQPTLIGNVGNYEDVLGDARFSYNLTSLKIWATKKGSAISVTFTDVLPEVYGAWPALVGDDMQPSALYVKLWSKNPFSIYEANTNFFYNGGSGTWTDWLADTYGNYPCSLPCSLVTNYIVPTILNEKDLILPPYHVFALAVESQATATGSGTGKTYRDVAYFHTEGVPLNLDPYVYLTIPEVQSKRHYRSYDVGLRFNETYMDLLYKEPGPISDLTYKDPDQKFIIEIINENGELLRDESGNRITITTRWEHAPDHIRTRTDEAWLDLLEERGIPITEGLHPKDDIIYARPDWSGGFRPSNRYKVRAWIDDKRLLNDTRMNDPIWLKVNKVREHEGQLALLYEFPLVTSAYNSFSELGGSYEDKWWPLEIAAFSPAQVDPIANNALMRTVSFATTIMNHDAGVIGRFLAQATNSLNPDDLSPGLLDEWIVRVPGYQDSPFELTNAEKEAILGVWKDELEAFERLEAHFALERGKEPLPLQVELNVLKPNNKFTGFLLELPEPIEWARVRLSMNYETPMSATSTLLTPAVIVNPAGTRAFIFDITSGSVTFLNDGTYRLIFEFHRDIGSRNPQLVAPDGLPTESFSIEAVLPDGFFEEEEL